MGELPAGPRAAMEQTGKAAYKKSPVETGEKGKQYLFNLTPLIRWCLL